MIYTTLIKPAELETHIGDPDWVIVDCRFDLMKPDWGFSAYQMAHIPGSIYAHMDHDLSGPRTAVSGRHPLPDVDQFTDLLSRWGIDSTKQVIVLDTSAGAYSVRLWWMLKHLGHPAAAVLDGGFPAWAKEIHRVNSGVEENSFVKCDLGGGFDGMMTTTQVQEILFNPDWCLIDARAPERFRGEQEPIDPIAGHIPGATNCPYTANLSSKGCMLPAGELRSQFMTLLGGIPPEQTVVYCGSGVSSCFHLLAMEIAGLPGAKLYAGSWSEWIRDPNRPIITGNKS